MESVHPSSHDPEATIRDTAIAGVMAEADPKDRCPVIDLGQADYSATYQLQKKMHDRRVKGEVCDVVFMLEHPPTYTIGKSGTMDNVLVSKKRLEKENISLFLH